MFDCNNIATLSKSRNANAISINSFIFAQPRWSHWGANHRVILFRQQVFRFVPGHFFYALTVAACFVASRLQAATAENRVQGVFSALK